MGMSFWFMLMAAVLLAISTWSSRFEDRAMTAVGLVSLVGVATIYPGGYLIIFLWMILWHAASVLYLWRASDTRRIDEDFSQGEGETWQATKKSQR
jgi:hypothetical protein